jgi:hypothetical protein
MTTQKQIEANRRNAQKSTGPKTPQGKAITSKNGIIHGLYAQDPVITSPRVTENQEEYTCFCNSLAGKLGPQTELERLVVEQIANCVWRQNRAELVEQAVKSGTLRPSRRLILDLLRNDRRIDRQMMRAYRLFDRLQSGAICGPTAADDFRVEQGEAKLEAVKPGKPDGTINIRLGPGSAEFASLTPCPG